MLNFYLEPQLTVLHNGANQPAVQVFATFNIQFKKKPPPLEGIPREIIRVNRGERGGDEQEE